MDILLVDDEAEVRGNLKLLLSLEGHTVREAEHGQAALAALADNPPDLIFSDVRMPVMDGYEFCRAVKAHEDWRYIPVTFISGSESIEARLEAFEAGAEDFIVKPFDVAELLHKVGTAARIIEETRALRTQASEAQSTAFTAMQWAAELGNVLEFMRQALTCQQPAALCQLIRHALQGMGLDATVMIHSGHEAHTLSQRGKDIPLDHSILLHLRKLERIFEFQRRAVFNYDSVTVVVHDMPRDDPALCGRLRDHLALLAEIADARNKTLSLENLKRSQADGLGSAIGIAESALAEISRSQQISERTLGESVDTLQDQLSSVFVGCGLKESQEASILAVIAEHREALEALLKEHQAATRRLDEVMAILKSLSAQNAGAL